MDEQVNSRSKENIKKLSVAERILIVEDIWDSIISTGEELPLTDEQKNEFYKRLETYYKNPNEGKKWKEVKNNIQSQI